jgi:hypothetical protein
VLVPACVVCFSVTAGTLVLRAHPAKRLPFMTLSYRRCRSISLQVRSSLRTDRSMLYTPRYKTWKNNFSIDDMPCSVFTVFVDTETCNSVQAVLRPTQTHLQVGTPQREDISCRASWHQPLCGSRRWLTRIQRGGNKGSHLRTERCSGWHAQPGLRLPDVAVSP